MKKLAISLAAAALLAGCMQPDTSVAPRNDSVLEIVDDAVQKDGCYVAQYLDLAVSRISLRTQKITQAGDSRLLLMLCDDGHQEVLLIER